MPTAVAQTTDWLKPKGFGVLNWFAPQIGVGSVPQDLKTHRTEPSSEWLVQSTGLLECGVQVPVQVSPTANRGSIQPMLVQRVPQ